MTKEELEERRAQLKAQLDEFVNQANRQIGWFNGQLELLDALIAEIRDKEPAQETE